MKTNRVKILTLALTSSKKNNVTEKILKYQEMIKYK